MASMLISALSQHSMAMENETALFTGDGSTTVLHVLIYALFTLLLLCFGCIWYLLTKVNYLYYGKKDLEIRVKLFKVMDLLKNRLLKSAGIKFGEDAEEEGKTDDESVGETQSEKQTRYHNSELCEVSDPEYWQLLHHGAPTESEDEQMEASLLQSMRDANAALETRIQRLQCEWDEAEAMNQLEAKPRAIVLQFFSHRVSTTHVRLFGLGRISGNWQGPENFVHTLRRIWSGSYPGSPHIFDRYSGSELTSLLCTDVRRMYDWNARVRAGLGSSWVAHVLLSVKVPE